MKYFINDPRLPDRLRSKLVESEVLFKGTPCWEFTGCLWQGYGFLQWGGKGRSIRTHRLTYQLLVGEIKEGEVRMVIDHLCKNRACCNPAHLEHITHAENVRRGDTWSSGKAQRAKTHCPAGHEYTKENTHIRVRVRNGSQTETRECRTCQGIKNRSPERRASWRRYNEKRVEVRLANQLRVKEEMERKALEKASKKKGNT